MALVVLLCVYVLLIICFKSSKPLKCSSYLLLPDSSFSAEMNSEIIDRIRKRRSEDDEDMMSFILPVLHRMRSRGPIERTQRHSSILYGKKRVDDILTGHVKNCLVAYRMEPRIFRALASYLRRENLISDKRIKVEEKLAFFLYMVSHNASYEDLQLEFQHSGQTFHEYINEFFNIVPILASRFLKPPNIDEPHPVISTDTRFYPYFQVSIFNASTISFLI